MCNNKILNEKTLLLNEIHHRVKNNFQIIISLIDLQADRNPENKEIFIDLINRIKSMSLTYEDLLLADDARFIKFSEYVYELVNNIKLSCDKNIKFVIKENGDKLLLDINVATSIGIVINELITNSCKYAFDNKECKAVEIILNNYKHEVEIHVNDNGCGIPKEFLHKDSNTLGLNLVKMLVKEQLGGFLYIKSDHGTKAFIRFNKENDDNYTK